MKKSSSNAIGNFERIRFILPVVGDVLYDCAHRTLVRIEEDIDPDFYTVTEVLSGRRMTSRPENLGTHIYSEMEILSWAAS